MLCARIALVCCLYSSFLVLIPGLISDRIRPLVKTKKKVKPDELFGFSAGFSPPSTSLFYFPVLAWASPQTKIPSVGLLMRSVAVYLVKKVLSFNHFFSFFRKDWGIIDVFDVQLSPVTPSTFIGARGAANQIPDAAQRCARPLASC